MHSPSPRTAACKSPCPAVYKLHRPLTKVRDLLLPSLLATVAMLPRNTPHTYLHAYAQYTSSQLLTQYCNHTVNISPGWYFYRPREDGERPVHNIEARAGKRSGDRAPRARAMSLKITKSLAHSPNTHAVHHFYAADFPDLSHVQLMKAAAAGPFCSRWMCVGYYVPVSGQSWVAVESTIRTHVLYKLKMSDHRSFVPIPDMTRYGSGYKIRLQRYNRTSTTLRLERRTSPKCKMGFLYHLAVSILAVVSNVAAAGPPCSGDTPIAVCAEFINPFYYEEWYWRTVPVSYNASLPDCGFPGFLTASCCSYWSPLCDNIALGCDVQTRRPLPDGISGVLPEDWSIYSTPCVVDSPPGSVFLDGVVVYTEENSPNNCAQTCDTAGYVYAGVEMGDQCWCANGLAASIEAAPLGEECNWPCQGQSLYSCGAYERVQILSKSSS
ncbi:hypothetical protein NM688_g7638 [Phlebia brevispora]|uniref:Uncharacterized protein n=1 Tax=Phlebia brevispora TaxID=194682 RepID=A0ACC1S322_9APHY|nr:hypothetical protein NM688_g7638 [Phlebia brevispora]